MTEAGYVAPETAIAPQYGDMIGVGKDGDLEFAAKVVEGTPAPSKINSLQAGDTVGTGDTAAVATGK